MNLCIFGYGVRGKKMWDALIGSRYTPICYCDNKVEKQGDDPAVLSADEAVRRVKDNTLDAICVPGTYHYKARIAMIRQLLSLGLSFDKIYTSERTERHPAAFPEIEPFLPSDIGQNRLAYPDAACLKVAVYLHGAGDPSARYIARLINLCFANVKVHCFVTENMSLAETCVDGLKVISVYAMGRLCRDGELNGVVMHVNSVITAQSERVRRLQALGATRVFTPSYLVTEKPMLDREDIASILTPYEDRQDLLKLDLLLTDHCNMGCQGCSHSASLAQPGFYDQAQCEKDLARMRELMGDHIKAIGFLGGEPLLHPGLPALIGKARELFPFTQLSIMTNGILVLGMSDALMEAMRTNNVLMRIDCYPPMFDRIDEMKRFTEEQGLWADFSPPYTYFSATLNSQGDSDIDQMYAFCGVKVCNVMRDGKISACRYPLTIQHLNSYFDADYPIYDEDWLNIYNPELTRQKILDNFHTPKRFCAWCSSDNARRYHWSRIEGRADIRRWVL